MARRTGEREKKRDRPAETLANGEQKQRRVPLFGAQNSALQGEILALSLSLEYEQYRAKVDQLENLCFQRNAPQGRRNELVFPVKRDEEIKEVCRGVDRCILEVQGISYARHEIGSDESQGEVRAKLRNLGAWCLMLL